MNQSNRTISNIVLITKILFCISLKYLKMYSIVFFSFFFCKVMLQHVFNNHNNINMNDIQNNNNYSHIITLAGCALATLPSVWPCKDPAYKTVFAVLRRAVFTLAYTECTARDLLTLDRRCSQLVNKGCVRLRHARLVPFMEVSEEV